MAVKVTVRLQVTKEGELYNWKITHVLGCYDMRGPGGFATVADAMEAVPAMAGSEYLLADVTPCSSPLVN